MAAELPSDDEDDQQQQPTQRVGTPAGSEDEEMDTETNVATREDGDSDEEDPQPSLPPSAAPAAAAATGAPAAAEPAAKPPANDDEDESDLEDEEFDDRNPKPAAPPPPADATPSVPPAAPASSEEPATVDGPGLDDNDSDEGGVTSSLATGPRVTQRSLAAEEASSRVSGVALGQEPETAVAETDAVPPDPAANADAGDARAAGDGCVDWAGLHTLLVVVRNHGPGNQPFRQMPKEDCLHARFVDRDDKPLEPKPIPVSVYHGNQQARNAYAETLWTKDPSWFMAAFQIWKGQIVRKGAAQTTAKTVVGMIPVAYEEPDDKTRDLISEPYQLLLPVPAQLVKKLYEQARNNLPTSYRPSEKLCKYLPFNGEKTAATDPRYVEVPTSTSKNRSAGAAGGGSKKPSGSGSKRKAAADPAEDEGEEADQSVGGSSTSTAAPRGTELVETEDAEDEDPEPTDPRPQPAEPTDDSQTPASLVLAAEEMMAKALMRADGAKKRIHKRMKISNYDMLPQNVNVYLQPGCKNAHIFVVYTD